VPHLRAAAAAAADIATTMMACDVVRRHV